MTHSLEMFMFKKVMIAAWIGCLPTLAGAQPEGPLRPAVGGVIDLPMYVDPDVRVPDATLVFSPRLKALWLEALARPEADLRWQAAAAFGEAATMGMEGLGAVTPMLASRLSDDVPEVRAAAAAALATIGDASAADAMLEADRRAAADAEMVLVIDPALAAWRHAPAYALWQERLADPRTPVVVAASAARSLGVAEVTDASGALLAAALSADRHPTLRIAAAEALQAMGADIALAEVQPLMGGGALQRILAAHLLAGSPAGKVAALRSLAGGDEPVAAGIAARALATVDAAAAMQLADHPEPAVRLAAVHAARREPADAAIRLLIDRLDDRATTVRTPAREALVELGREDRWSDPVRQGLAEVLRAATMGWRGLEQAALAAGSLDMEPSGEALLRLLEHDRPEVSLAAASALRELADPATLSSVFEHAQRLTEAARQAGPEEGAAGERSDALTEHRISGEVPRSASIANDTTQLFMLLGELDYAPADPLMRRYIPKNAPFDPEARASAIWALGKIHAGEADGDLVRAFAQRVADIQGMEPEADVVRQMAAISIGRMRGDGEANTLRRFAESEDGSEVGRASRWALAQIDGAPADLPTTRTAPAQGWFLQPAD